MDKIGEVSCWSRFRLFSTKLSAAKSQQSLRTIPPSAEMGAKRTLPFCSKKTHPHQSPNPPPGELVDGSFFQCPGDRLSVSLMLWPFPLSQFHKADQIESINKQCHLECLERNPPGRPWVLVLGSGSCGDPRTPWSSPLLHSRAHSIWAPTLWGTFEEFQILSSLRSACYISFYPWSKRSLAESAPSVRIHLFRFQVIRFLDLYISLPPPPRVPMAQCLTLRKPNPFDFVLGPLSTGGRLPSCSPLPLHQSLTKHSHRLSWLVPFLCLRRRVRPCYIPLALKTSESRTRPLTMTRELPRRASRRKDRCRMLHQQP